MDYTVYRMQSYFSKQPGQPTHCPYCQQRLSQTYIEPSAFVANDLTHTALIPTHDYSLLFTCPNCGGWMIRESWDFRECLAEMDFVVVGRPVPVQEKPWLEALADPALYDHDVDLPEWLGRIFPGGKRK